MRTADHMNLSRYIMDKAAGDAPGLLKFLFIFGSIEPDINMLTYFRGSIKGDEKLRGHNYENVRTYMEWLTKKLENEKMGRFRKSFLLGKLVHYVADSFTYPHNSFFPGSLREHCQYETELHGYVNRMIEMGDVNMDVLPADVDVMEYIEEMHEEYEQDMPGMETDYGYITSAISMVTERFWQTETASSLGTFIPAAICKQRVPS